MTTLNIQAMEYQQAALTDFSTRFIGVSGGKRSGKSRMITCLKSIILSSLHPGHPGVVASPVFGMTVRNLLPIYRELANDLGITIRGLDVQAPPKLEIDWPGGTSTIWLNVTIENWGRMNGLSLAWACIDEADKARLVDMREFMQEAIIRISNPYPGREAQINVTGAPELNGFLAEFFLEQAAPDKKLFKWSMMQNDMLSDKYKESILSTIPEKLQAGWIFGEFMYNSDGLVYDSYDPDENNINFTIADVMPDEKIWVSWDINDGGCNAHLCVRRGKHEITFMEWPKLKDTDKVIEKVKQQPWASRAVLTCDPACTQVFPYIQKSGLAYNIMNSHPEIEWRVTAMNLRMGTKSPCTWDGVVRRHWLINKSKCPILNKCLMRQGYEKGEPQKGSKYWIEEAGTDISGPLDGVGYRTFLFHPYNGRGPATPIKLRF